VRTLSISLRTRARLLATFGILLAGSMTINIADPGTSFAATPTVRTLNLGPTPYALAIDTTTDTLYAARIASSTTVSVINGDTNRVTDHIHVGSSVGNMAMDPTTDTLYAEDEPFLGISATTAPKPNGYSLLAIDGKTDRVIHTVHIDRPFSSIAVDPATNTIYLQVQSTKGHRGEWSLLAIDGKTDRVIHTVHIGSLGPMTIDPATNRIYVAGSRSLLVINGATDKVVDTIHIGPGASSLAMNPITDTLYVGSVSATTAPKPNGSSLLAIDGKTDRVIHTTHIGGAAFSSIAVDPATNTIYASDTLSMSVSVVNGGTGAVISSIRLGKEHFLGFGLAIDPNTNTLYGQGFRSLVVVDLANQNHRALSLNSSWFTVAGIVVVAGGSLFIARMRRRRPSAS